MQVGDTNIEGMTAPAGTIVAVPRNSKVRTHEASTYPAKTELEESDFDEYLDSEEELKRDQQERQRVMDAIKLKHS